MSDAVDPAVSQAAAALLDRNWLGSSTRPAPRLYPHQWSWDSAFVAIGNRHHRPDRAAAELRTLFQAQWSNGMVPHIAFRPPDPPTINSDYVPAPGIWQGHAASPAPNEPATSGICQPPVHASAALLVHRADPDANLAADLYEPLAAWHDYLHQYRAIDGDLVEIWHPWESGMDNSPVWDGPLARLDPAELEVTAYRRVDTDHVNPEQRPSDLDYDRYVHLVGRLRQHGYQPSDPRQLPFRVRDVLFNAILARAELDLAELGDTLGPGAGPHRERAAALIEAMDQEQWDERGGIYLDVDAVSGKQIPVPIAGGLMPLIVPLRSDRRARLITTVREAFVVHLSSSADALLTVPTRHPKFDAACYWRGPAWINMMWLLARGLAAHGAGQLAARLERGIVQLVERAGFHEYFDPATGRGLGAEEFSWTASLYLDVTATQ